MRLLALVALLSGCMAAPVPAYEACATQCAAVGGRVERIVFTGGVFDCWCEVPQ